MAQSDRFLSNPDQGVVPSSTPSLLRLATSTSTTDQEGEGLETLVYCEGLAHEAGPDPVIERALPLLKALLQTGHAVNAGQAGAAAERYLDALGSNLDAGQPLSALDIVRRLMDLAKPGKPTRGTLSGYKKGDPPDLRPA